MLATRGETSIGGRVNSQLTVAIDPQWWYDDTRYVFTSILQCGPEKASMDNLLVRDLRHYREEIPLWRFFAATKKHD